MSARHRLALVVLWIMAGCAHREPVAPDAALTGDAPFRFALVGDVPYTDAQTAMFDNLIAAVNADRRVRFVLHVGDIKGGSAPCDDAALLGRFRQYQRFDRPFVYTPGDNEWTDCHRGKAGRFYPPERLARLREIFFPAPGFTAGMAVKVRSQSALPDFAEFVENVLWVQARVVFATVHVVGSNNNLEPWSGIDPGDSAAHPRADRLAEFQRREAAALAWLEEVFRVARQRRSAGVFVAIHANPNFDLAAEDAGRQGFNAFLDLLEAKTVAYGRPVVLAHGGSHYFRIDKPLFGPTVDGPRRRLEHFTRVETFGTDDVHWIRVNVDPADPNVFGFEPAIVPANRFARPPP
ncbi:MAG: hypothetical protein M3Z21_04835 [Pseudomonadota bacterium]|nr:hypothetical protein [Pseudomonadota bacterium]